MRDLLRSTPFRLAALLGGSLLLALAVVGAVIYSTIDGELRKRVEQTVADQFDEIVRSADGDLADLTLEVYGYALATNEFQRVYLLTDRSGQVMAGNTVSADVPDGWSTVTGDALGLAGSRQTYRVLAGEVLDDRLVVGVSYAEAEELSGVVLGELIWIGVGFVTFIGLVATIAARRGARRLQTIADTMKLVGRGDLDARIALGRGNSDLDVLAGQVNDALDRLSALVDAMRQVSADIAHELKTPLSRLSIAVEGALEAEAEGRPVAARLEELQTEARRLNSVFEALLRIAQIESGARRSRFVRVDMAPILSSLHDAYAAVAEEGGMQFDLRAAPSLPPVLGDRDLLVQMLANLIENALRHCPPGTLITAEADATASGIRLAIRDTGPGIPPGEREKVFRRLYRLEKSRTTPGSGLGMSLVKAIVELHGGTVALADNHPGLVVLVELPVAPKA